MLLGYADSPDAQLAVCPVLDAAPMVAYYPAAEESARDGSLGRGRVCPGCGPLEARIRVRA